MTMKRIFIQVLLVSTVAIFILSSCKKDLQAYSDHSDNSSNTGTSLFTFNLKADNWISEGDGIYVNSFRNIIHPRYYGRSIKVYLLTENREIQINHFIYFMGGELWASVSGTDMTLIYHSFRQRPFDHLNIKVLIQ